MRVSTLCEAVLALLPDGRAAALRQAPDLDGAIAAVVKAGSDAHPTIRVAPIAWAHHLARHLASEGTEGELDKLRAADLHVVLACGAGDTTALACLDTRLRGVVAQALSGIRLGTLSVDELLQDVRVKLLVGERSQTKLDSYSGKGPLDGWLRVTIARTALSWVRSQDPMRPAAENDDPIAKLAGDENQELAVLRARSAPVLKKAIETSMAELAPGTRALLRLHVVDGLTIDDLAGVYRVHRATIARRVAKARSELFERARARAVAALGIGDVEFASLIGMMMSQIDLTLHTVEAEAPPSDAS